MTDRVRCGEQLLMTLLKTTLQFFKILYVSRFFCRQTEQKQKIEQKKNIGLEKFWWQSKWIN